MENSDYVIKLIESLKNRVATLIIANIELEAALLTSQEETRQLLEQVANTAASKTE